MIRTQGKTTHSEALAIEARRSPDKVGKEELTRVDTIVQRSLTYA